MLTRSFVNFVLFGGIGCVTYGLMPTYVMQDTCDRIFDLNESSSSFSGEINYTFTGDDEWSDSRSWDDCTVTFRSLGSKFAIRFMQLRVYDCLRVNISVLEQDADGHTRKLHDMPSDLCGTSTSIKLHEVYVTEWPTLVVHINKRNLKLVYLLSLIFNLFTEGPCSGDQYACNNGRCIHESLTSSGFNPCGDESDCPHSSDELTSEHIAGIVVGAVFVVGIIVLVLAFCVIRNKHHNNKSEIDQMKLT